MLFLVTGSKPLPKKIEQNIDLAQKLALLKGIAANP
jgi:hypothetical protein